MHGISRASCRVPHGPFTLPPTRPRHIARAACQLRATVVLSASATCPSATAYQRASSVAQPTLREFTGQKRAREAAKAADEAEEKVRVLHDGLKAAKHAWRLAQDAWHAAESAHGEAKDEAKRLRAESDRLNNPEKGD